MEYQQLCEILEVSPDEDLADGFKRLFALYPDSSCPSVQLINCLLPLIMECMRTCFLEDHVLVQCNQYLFVKVIQYRYYIWYYMYFSLPVMPSLKIILSSFQKSLLFE